MKIDYTKFISILILAVLLILTPKFSGFVDDINCWIRWADTIRENGLRNVYDGDTNYLPVYQYVLWAFAQLAPNKDFLVKYSFLLRYVTLAIELAGLWMIYKWSNRKTSFGLILIISLLNLAYIYDNIIWGQVDGILAALSFGALYCVYERKYVGGALLLCLMLNFKLQGVVFVPLYVLLLLAQTPLRQWPKRLLQSLVVFTVVQVVILLPFMLKEGGVQQVLDTLKSLVGYVPKVSSLAYNFWSFFLGTNADITPDTQIAIFGLSYREVGLLLFFTSSFITLLPLMVPIYKKAVKNQDIQALPKESVWLTGALIGLLFFFFNTQMHERYSFPAFIFIAALFFNNKKQYWIPYLLFSYACFMNMEFVLRWLHLDNYEHSFFFNRIFISSVFGVVILYLWFKLYRKAISLFGNRLFRRTSGTIDKTGF